MIIYGQHGDNTLYLDLLQGGLRFAPVLREGARFETLSFYWEKVIPFLEIEKETGIITQLKNISKDTDLQEQILGGGQEVMVHCATEQGNIKIKLTLKAGLYYTKDRYFIGLNSEFRTKRIVPNLSRVLLNELHVVNWAVQTKDQSKNVKIAKRGFPGRLTIHNKDRWPGRECHEFTIQGENKGGNSDIKLNETIWIFTKKDRPLGLFSHRNIIRIDLTTSDFKKNSFHPTQIPDKEAQLKVIKYIGLPYFLKAAPDGSLHQICAIPSDYASKITDERLYFEALVKNNFQVGLVRINIAVFHKVTPPPPPPKPKPKPYVLAANDLIDGIHSDSTDTKDFGSTIRQSLWYLITQELTGSPKFGGTTAYINNGKTNVKGWSYHQIFFSSLSSGDATLRNFMITTLKDHIYNTTPSTFRGFGRDFLYENKVHAMINVIILQMIKQKASVGDDLDSTKIDDDVHYYNELIQAVVYQFYRFQYQKKIVDPLIKKYSLTQTDYPNILTHCKELLNGNRAASIANGEIKPNLLMIYHYWILLNSLGMNTGDLHAFIGTFFQKAALDRNNFQGVDADHWTQYFDWMPDLSHYYTYEFSGFTVTKIISHPIIYNYTAVLGIGNSLTSTVGRHRNIAFHEKHTSEGIAKVFVEDFGQSYEPSSCFSGDTYILTQDGKGVRIDQVKPSALVNNGTGIGRTVKGINTPPRGRRALYSINDFGFKFTPSHPFVNYYHNQPNQPYWLSVDPHSLVQWIPTFHDAGVGPLVKGMTIKGYDPVAKKAIPIKVESLTAYLFPLQGKEKQLRDMEPSHLGADQEKEDGTDTVMYDLLLSPKEVAHDKYLDDYTYLVSCSQHAGSKYLYTSSEIPMVGRYAEASQAILRILSIAAPTIANKGENVKRLSKDSQMAYLEDPEIASSSEQIAQLIFDQTMLKTISYADSEQATVAHEMMKDLELEPTQNIDLETVVNGFLQLIGKYETNGDLNSAVSRTFAFFISRYAREIATIIELGWRVFPLSRIFLEQLPERSVQADPHYTLSVTVGDLLLNGLHPIQDPEAFHRMSLQCYFTTSITQVEDIQLGRSARMPTPYVQHVDQVLYFDEQHLNLDLEHTKQIFVLIFKAVIQNKERAFRAQLDIHSPLQRTYRRYIVPLKDENGIICGSIAVDTRRLNQEELELEHKNATKPWDKASKASFADVLGKAWARSLVSYINGMPYTLKDIYFAGKAAAEA